ncbi:hypothetical protein D3C74_402340 [compost metagenome]
MTVISTDGASAVTKNVASVLGEGQQVIKQLTGVDINQLIAGLAGGHLSGQSVSNGSSSASSAASSN